MTIATISNGESVAAVTTKLNETIAIANKALVNDAAGVIDVASTAALAVGPNGATNATLLVDTNTESAATGIEVTGAAAAAGVTVAAISSGDNENLILAGKGTGSVVMAKADVNGGAVDATVIGGATPAAGTFTTVTATTVNGTTFDTNVAAAGVTLAGVTLAADGTDAAININITPKGTGEVNLPKVDIDAGTIDGVTLGNTCVYIVPSTDPVVAGALWLDGATLKISAGA